MVRAGTIRLKQAKVYLAKVDLGMHGSLDVVHIVVDHRKRDAHGQYCHHGEGDGRVGDEAIRFDPLLQIHRV